MYRYEFSLLLCIILGLRRFKKKKEFRRKRLKERRNLRVSNMASSIIDSKLHVHVLVHVPSEGIACKVWTNWLQNKHANHGDELLLLT